MLLDKCLFLKFRYCHELNMKNSEETDNFLEECMADPSLRDKYSLLTRSLRNKIKVRSII